MSVDMGAADETSTTLGSMVLHPVRRITQSSVGRPDPTW
jgi:hypothetical protein